MSSLRLNCEPYVVRWRLLPDGEGIETQSSWLLPVRRAAVPAMLKVPKPASDECNSSAAALLRYFDGKGAVRLYKADEGAQLLERARGPRSLMAMATSGKDADAAEIMAGTIAMLQEKRNSSVPTGLIPLQERFSSLYSRAATTSLLGRCANVARSLLVANRDVVPLHGDLHHENILDAGPRGWLAIDPKALIGERTYEVANLLCNPQPHGAIVHSGDRMRRLAELYATVLRLDVRRVLAFAFAHAGLSASWAMDDGRDPAYRIRCAEVLLPLLDR